MADDKVCVVEMADGSLQVVIPFWVGYTLDPAAAEEGKELIEDLEDFFDAQIVKAGLAADKPAAREVRRMTGPAGDLPYDGPFLAAWKFNADTTAVEVDMAKARAIRIDLIRPERDARLLALDADYMIADEAGDSAAKAAVAARKQALRDLPATIQPDLDAIADPEVLEAWQPVWPE